MAFSAEEYLKLRGASASANTNEQDFAKRFLAIRDAGQIEKMRSQMNTEKAQKALDQQKVHTDPDRAKELESKPTWFQAGAFEDGYDFGDVSKTILGSTGDISQNVLAGFLGIGEKAVDAGAYVVGATGGLFSDEFKQKTADFIAKDLYDEKKLANNPLVSGTSPVGYPVFLSNILGVDIDQSSVMGDKVDSLAQSGGQLAGTALLKAASVPWWVTSGVTSFGGEAENALNQGATMEEAGLSALVTAGAEVLTEKLFGGSGLGEKGLINLDKLTKGVSNKVVKTLLDYGVDMAAEGGEEALSQVMSNLSSALYKEENLWQLLASEEAFQGYLDAFVGGMVLSGGMNVGKVANSVATQTDYRTGLTAQQQKFFDKAYSEALAQAQKDGTKLTGEQKRAIYDATLEAVKNGNVAGAGQAQQAESTQSGEAAAVQDSAQLPQQTVQAKPGTLEYVMELAQSGGLTNKQAQAVVDQPDLYRTFLELAGIESPATASGKRNAVKQAVAQIGQQQNTNNNQINIDNANNVAYNNSINGGEQIERTAGIGEDQRGVSGVYANSGADATGRGERSGVSVGAGLVLLSPSSQEALKSRGVVNLELHDSSMDNAAFSLALDAARNADAANGWAVTPKTEKELHDAGVRTFMTANGSTGFAIAPDGDIEAVFANKAVGAPKGSTKYTIPLAIANGGTKLDCYGAGLVRLYAQYGFVPVARTAFNPEYANPGWTVDKGNPDIYFMMHNGESADAVVQNYGQYHIPTKEELDALPLMEYDDAYAYRDELLAQQKAQQGSQAAQDGQIMQTPTGITQAQNSPQNLNARALGGNTVDAEVKADDSVGAAPAGFDPNSHLQYQYGTMPEHQNAVRPDDLPNRDANGNPISRVAGNIKGAKITPDAFVPLLDRMATGGELSYVSVTNDATTQKAMEDIMRYGWEGSLAAWQKGVREGKAGADMTATGALLLNNAAQAGDKALWCDILADMQLLGTNTAQGLQAFKIIKQLAPSDKLYMIRRSVEQLAKDAGYDLQIDEDLARQYQEAETDTEADKILDKIAKDVAGQIKTTWGEKWTAIRYLNMLGNFRTQIRNLSGNLTMGALNKAKNAVAVGIEAVANKVSGGKIQKTKSLTVNKEQLRSAMADYDTVADAISNGGRYNDPNAQRNAFMQKVQDNKQVFGFKPLEGYRKATSWAMEKGDVLFSKPAYAWALAGYLKAKGITETDLSRIDPKIMDDARLYAVKEAQEVTFRDNNWLSTQLSKLGRGKDSNKWVKVVLDGILPFRKTPANVLIRAEQYSPLGFFNAVGNTVRAANGDISANAAIESWAKGLTGTGVFFLGMLLYNCGLMNAGGDDDEKKAAFDRMNGVQPYSLNIGGNTYTIDWASPAAVPLLMGGEFMKNVSENGLSLQALSDALASIADPMIEMSMLQGVNDTLENVRYVENPLGQILINASLSYLTQGLTNTAAGQIERSFEESRMQTYTDKNSELPDWLQKFIGKNSAKTPGWDYNQIPYINAWGEEEENMTPALGLVYNMLSPGYGDLKEDTPLTRELYRLDKAQGENVFPSTPGKSFKANGETVNMTAEQYVKAAKTKGQTQKRIVEDLIGSRAYRRLSDEDKARAVRKAYEYAWDYTKQEVFGVTIDTKWMRGIEGEEAEAILEWVQK